MLVCQIQTLQRDHQDNCEEEKHVDKEIKTKRVTDTSRPRDVGETLCL